MIPITSTTTQSQLQIGPAKRESDQQQFRSSLDMQSVALLQTMLDPSLTASLPGAASALTDAEVADQDVAAMASQKLTQQDARLGSRGRGHDASSQARQQLGTQATSQAFTEQASPETQTQADTTQAERSEAKISQHTPRNREGSEQAREVQPTSSDTQQGVRHQPEARTFAGADADEGAHSQFAGKRGEGAFKAIAAPAAAASSAAAPNASSGAAPVSSVGKVMPPASTGQAADQRTPTAHAKKQVIRHEPRTIDAQLQRGLAQVLRQKGGTLSLRLNPVDLGEVKISLSIAQGRVDGSIEASTESARGLLNQNIEKLKSSLEQRGITVDRLEVRLAGAGSSGTQVAQGQEAQADLDQQQADAGSGRQQGSAPGEDRQRGDRGRIPDESVPTGLRGAESAADDDAAHGSAAEPLGGWLRLDTLA